MENDIKILMLGVASKFYQTVLFCMILLIILMGIFFYLIMKKIDRSETKIDALLTLERNRVNREQLKQKILDIRYPDKENEQYFEWHSADGFAFLGAAKEMLGLDHEYELQAVRERSFSLNHWNYINDVKVSERNRYVYTIYSCMEFLKLVDTGKCLDLSDCIEKDIGRYPNGWQRYSTEEPFLIVPNATSAAALIYCWTGKTESAKRLVSVLKGSQNNEHNWDYLKIDQGYKQDNPDTFKITGSPRQEDCYYLAMMIYHLREIERVTDGEIETFPIYNKAFNWLSREGDRCEHCHKTDGWFCDGSVGWGVPMMTLAVSGLGFRDNYLGRLEVEGIGKTESYLDHPNFRVRGMAAWALAKRLEKRQ